MPTISNSKIPEPKSWDEFEDITLSALRVRWNSADLCRHGRQGQGQEGVDIYGNNSKNKFVGIQCKNTLREITEKIVNDEVKLATSFTPKISRLYIATTAPRDVKIQKYVRTLSAKREQANGFPVQIIFWDEIASDLSGDPVEFRKHYPQFSRGVDRPKTVDEVTFDMFLELLPSDGVIRFLKTNNMAGFPFRMAKLDPLIEFVANWNNADHEFLNEGLEVLRVQLWKSVNQYCHDIATNTWVCDSNAELSIVPAEWEISDPERFWSVVKSLHAQANEIVETHQELVRAGRKHFNS